MVSFMPSFLCALPDFLFFTCLRCSFSFYVSYMPSFFVSLTGPQFLHPLDTFIFLRTYIFFMCFCFSYMSSYILCALIFFTWILFLSALHAFILNKLHFFPCTYFLRCLPFINMLSFFLYAFTFFTCLYFC